MQLRINRSSVVVAGLVLGTFAPAAFAYLDPSTGSMILSAIVGIFATAGLALKTYWYKFKSLLKGPKTDEQVAQQEGTPESSAERE